jgi:ubiquinone/menaquinone biosynthesis C-methylase UbiE
VQEGERIPIRNSTGGRHGSHGAHRRGYDAAAPSFDRHRALPGSTAEAIRAAVLDALAVRSPRLLDLGCGTGRIGFAFMAAGDDYVGVDFSFGMVAEFARRSRLEGVRCPRLVQADGRGLPFPDVSFDAVMLVQVFGGMREWRTVLAEARRVLRPAGALILGRSAAPAKGVDAAMKQRLALILDEMRTPARTKNTREEAERWLDAEAAASRRIVAAEWTAERSPRGFLERHRAGARFSALPEQVKGEAMQRLAAWAEQEFGALDGVRAEQHEFELKIFGFGEGARG